MYAHILAVLSKYFKCLSFYLVYNVIMKIKWLAFLSVGLLLAGCLTQASWIGSLPHQNIDVARYLGTWYEIARIPNWFEGDLVGVTATYALKPDGHVEVRNAGYDHVLTGDKKTEIGDAWIPDPKETGQLKVSFFWPFSGDYVVLYRDEDYQVAMVGSGKDLLWILCRKPSLSEATYKKLINKAEKLGFDVSRLQKVTQNSLN